MSTEHGKVRSEHLTERPSSICASQAFGRFLKTRRARRVNMPLEKKQQLWVGRTSGLWSLMMILAALPLPVQSVKDFKDWSPRLAWAMPGSS